LKYSLHYHNTPQQSSLSINLQHTYPPSRTIFRSSKELNCEKTAI